MCDWQSMFRSLFNDRHTALKNQETALFLDSDAKMSARAAQSSRCNSGPVGFFKITTAFTWPP